MKNTKQIILVLLAFAVLSVAQVQGQTNFTASSGTLNASIPDGSPIGLVESTNLSGLIGYVSSVQVTLNITGGFNGDLYAYLLGPQGGFSVLLNRVGITGSNPFGYDDTGFNITLDASGVNVHGYGGGSYTTNGLGQVTGLWAPDGRNINPQSSGSVFDAASTAAGFGVFDSINPNGQWTLFIADLSGGGSSTLVSWGLTIVTVPEPQTWAMVLGGAGMLLALRRRKNS
jgi:subtilisin-like proprotein convertase family protein